MKFPEQIHISPKRFMILFLQINLYIFSIGNKSLFQYTLPILQRHLDEEFSFSYKTEKSTKFVIPARLQLNTF